MHEFRLWQLSHGEHRPLHCAQYTYTQLKAARVRLHTTHMQSHFVCIYTAPLLFPTTNYTRTRCRENNNNESTNKKIRKKKMCVSTMWIPTVQRSGRRILLTTEGCRCLCVASLSFAFARFFKFSFRMIKNARFLFLFRSDVAVCERVSRLQTHQKPSKKWEKKNETREKDKHNEYYGFICSRGKKAHFDRELPHKSIKLERSREGTKKIQSQMLVVVSCAWCLVLGLM